MIWLKLMLSMVLLCCLPACACAENVGISAWLPYWELDDALGEADSLSTTLDELVAFAAIFDRNDAPKMLEDADTLWREMSAYEEDVALYLSVVNDLEIAEGQYDNKSTDLLRRLFKDDESISRHIEQLFQLVDTYDVAGLEIDYENMKSDAELWARFTVFVDKLYQQLSREGIKLRVVLSWDAPKYAQLPEGPEYSVMCYNLYGYHSGPGPKADIAFLEQTCQLYENVPGVVRMAFATGGFDWHGDSITALTQLEAETMLDESGVTPERDPLSGALKATLTLDGTTHELWYADATTLKDWQAITSIYGFDQIDLFRLGGNDLTDWQDNLLAAQTK